MLSAFSSFTIAVIALPEAKSVKIRWTISASCCSITIR